MLAITWSSGYSSAVVIDYYAKSISIDECRPRCVTVRRGRLSLRAVHRHPGGSELGEEGSDSAAGRCAAGLGGVTGSRDDDEATPRRVRGLLLSPR